VTLLVWQAGAEVVVDDALEVEEVVEVEVVELTLVEVEVVEVVETGLVDVEVEVEVELTLVEVDEVVVELGLAEVVETGVSALHGLPCPQAKYPLVRFSLNRPMTVSSWFWMLWVTPWAL
jgi:hypothetical protein